MERHVQAAGRMGQDAITKVIWEDRAARARVHLDSNKLDVFLKPALHLPFANIREATAQGGELRVAVGKELLVLRLGESAERWASKIQNPRGLLDKLGIERGDSRVTLIGWHDAEFEAALLTRIDRLFKRPVPDAAAVFFRPLGVKDLAKLRKLRAQLAPSGAIWVLREKGKAPIVRLRESEVREAARGAGLVDVDAVALSDKLAADKYVIAPAAGR